MSGEILSSEEFKLDCSRIVELAKVVFNRFPSSCLISNLGGLDYAICYYKSISKVSEMDYFVNDLIECYEDEVNGLPCCGCGNPELVRKSVFEILRCQNCENNFKEVRKVFVGIDKDDLVTGMYEFSLHALETAGYLTHGGTITNARLTDKGKEFLALCELYYKYLDS